MSNLAVVQSVCVRMNRDHGGAGEESEYANVAAKTFQCTECSAVLLSPTEFQLHIDRRHMNGNDSNNDEDSDVEAVSEDDFGKVSDICP